MTYHLNAHASNGDSFNTSGTGLLTAPITPVNLPGRLFVGLVWAPSRAPTTISGTPTFAGHNCTDLFGKVLSTTGAWWAFTCAGDANIPADGSAKNFLVQFDAQITIGWSILVIDGLNTTTPVVGTAQQGHSTSAAPTVGGHASWTGNTAFGFGQLVTSNFSSITAGPAGTPNTTLDFGGMPAYPLVPDFAGHRAGGNVSVNFASDHSDEWIMVGLSLADPASGLTQKLRIPATGVVDGVVRKLWIFTDNARTAFLVSNQTVVSSGGFFKLVSGAGTLGTQYPALLLEGTSSSAVDSHGGETWATVIEE